MILRINDFRKVGMCVTGIKSFCRKHDIDMRDLIKNGIEEKDALKINDAMVQNAVREIKNGK